MVNAWIPLSWRDDMDRLLHRGRVWTEPPAVEEPKEHQYALGKIIAIWALATAPMPFLAFVVAPSIAPAGGVHGTLVVWYLMIAGMVWQFVLSLILLQQECGLQNWSAIKQRIWLQSPKDPRTDVARPRLFWWMVPAFLFYLAVEFSGVGTAIGELILVPFPRLAELPSLNLSDLNSPHLKGAWWLVGVAIISCIFNYILGEELLFRGILLPKMRGVFGPWDWVANSVLFGLYHLHRPTQMLGFVVSGLAWPFLVGRYRSIWFAIVLHGIEGLFVVGIAVAIVS